MVANTLFNQPLMNKYIKKYDKQFTAKHSQKEALNSWIKKLEKGDLKDEVANYGRFSRMILETILGYDYEENIEENVKEDYGRGLSEFALKKGNKKFMVIELKGSDADLDKPQNRVNDKRTPVDQAFDYAKRSGDIDWIFVSNYKEFRLYNWHKKQHNYISFMAEDLVDPENFKSFMLVFSKFSTVDHNLIEKLVSKTIFVERDLEAEFYKLYNETRLMLIAELEYLHPEFTREKSVHYSQLILNRYIFICFAEDLGLLPEEISVETIEKAVEDQRLRGSEIWHDLNGLFIDVDKGNEFREEKIYGYNGGLFQEDIEFLKIRDIVTDQSIFNDAYQKWKFEEYSLLVEEKLSPYSGKINPIYKNFMTISSFNFSSELDVNILGHIFENSIGDIEELKADEKGRRKKDGIFYTPEYITDYICRNTIIPYLSKSGKATNVEKLVREYWGSEIKQLDEKVRNIKIVDPACGSGAFLNKASDVLLEIHEKIHEIEYKDDPTLNPYFDDVKERRNILLNNIYGVDLNEESVEITKLALFLKISKKGLKLPNLDKNIKCGNSLIDDIEYAEEKAFKWETEFSEIFEKGGFDIVIGNPPYVNIYKISDNKEDVKYFQSRYETAHKKFDLYVLFTEKSLKILKNKGLMGFIIPDKFANQPYGLKLREYLLNYSLIKQIVDLTRFKIFQDAINTPLILILKREFNKENTDSNEIKIVLPKLIPEEINQDIIKTAFIPQNMFKQIPENRFRLNLSEKTIPIIKKIERNSIYLGDICYINWGTRSVPQSKFHLKESINSKCKPLIVGKNVNRYSLDYKNLWLLYEPENLYNPMFPELFENEKIIIRDISGEKGILAVYDNLNYYTSHTTSCCLLKHILSDKINDESGIELSKNFNLKFILAIINSSLLDFYFKMMISSGIHVYLNDLRELRIYPVPLEKQEPFIENVNTMLHLNRDLQDEINSFHTWLHRTFNVEKLSKKLEKYYKLDFEGFLKEIKKQKVDIKPRKTQEILETEFNKSLKVTNPLLQKIKETDREIDKMVYDLYGLTPEEEEIVEENLK